MRSPLMNVSVHALFLSTLVIFGLSSCGANDSVHQVGAVTTSASQGTTASSSTTTPTPPGGSQTTTPPTKKVGTTCKPESDDDHFGGDSFHPSDDSECKDD